MLTDYSLIHQRTKKKRSLGNMSHQRTHMHKAKNIDDEELW